jgi:hypothetical protein
MHSQWEGKLEPGMCSATSCEGKKHLCVALNRTNTRGLVTIGGSDPWRGETEEKRRLKPGTEEMQMGQARIGQWPP